jgi:hypothetical protein
MGFFGNDVTYKIINDMTLSKLNISELSPPRQLLQNTEVPYPDFKVPISGGNEPSIW